MFATWVVFHVIVCVALIIVVLMQSSKGDGLAGSTFGGGISGAVFGGRGAAGFLGKATTVLAVVFMVNCGALAFMSARTRTVSTGTPDQTTTESSSAVTREAGKFQEEMATRQQAAQQKAAADSAAKATPPVQLVPPTDTGKK